MEITARLGRGPCGFCSTGQRHDLCPSGVLNGNGQEVILCACNCEQSQLLRCMDCNNRAQDDVDPKTWRCIDHDSCRGRIEHRLANDPIIRQIREIRERTAAQATADRAAKRAAATDPHSHEELAVSSGPAKAPRATSGSCLHCGEPTKGGKFLPGHDSTYLSSLIAGIKEGRFTLDGTLAMMREQGCSEALQAKLQKRVVAA